MEILSHLDEYIRFLDGVECKNYNLKTQISEYFRCQKDLIMYVEVNLPTDTIDVQHLKKMKAYACDVMNQIINQSSNEDDKTFLDVCDMMKETYDSINMLCTAFGAS
jgi:hypothetical protein